MNEVRTSDQSYGLHWILWLEGRMYHWHRWMKCYPGTSPKAIIECCDFDRCSMGIDEWSATHGPVLYPLLKVVTWIQMFHGIDAWSATQGPVLWTLLNVATGRQMFHGHRWMKCYPETSPKATTECCDLDKIIIVTLFRRPSKTQVRCRNFFATTKTVAVLELFGQIIHKEKLGHVLSLECSRYNDRSMWPATLALAYYTGHASAIN
jgi:hypothetical protein